MLVLTVLVHAASALLALLAVYYVVKDFAADLVLLGGCALVLLLWLVETAILAGRDALGASVPDPITLYGYLLTGLAMGLGGIWLGVGERTRWGSAAIGLVAATMIVLQMRMPQIWPAGF